LDYRKKGQTNSRRRKKEANAAKETIRQALKQKLGIEDDDIGFVDEKGKQQIRVFENLERKEKRTRSEDLR